MPGKVQIPETIQGKKKKSKYLWETLESANPDGEYFCCYGSSLSGPSNSIFGGKAYGVAEQFSLKKAASVTTLAAAVGYVSGDKSVTLTLYEDNGSNSPGTELATGTGTSSTEFGECCGVVSVTISSASLKANTPYWVGITTTGSNYEAAPFQVYNEVNNDVYVAYTTNGGSSWGSGTQLTEYNPAIGVK
jgi:hypothetical protein